MGEQPTKSPSDMLTPKEVAAMWRVDVRTIRRWVQLGRLRPSRMSGGTVRFRRSEVDRAMEKYEYGNPDPRNSDPAMR